MFIANIKQSFSLKYSCKYTHQLAKDQRRNTFFNDLISANT
jgi:hypothetical protein